MVFKKNNKTKFLVSGFSICSILGISLLAANSLFSSSDNVLAPTPRYYNNGRKVDGKKNITVDPNQNYAANGLLWSYPTPRYNPIEITELYTSINNNLLYDYGKSGGAGGDDWKYKIYNHSYDKLESYKPDEYTNPFLNESKYGVELGQDGSLKFVREPGKWNENYYLHQNLWLDKSIGPVIDKERGNYFVVTDHERPIPNQYSINNGNYIIPNFSVDTYSTDGLIRGKTKKGEPTNYGAYEAQRIDGLEINEKSLKANATIKLNDSKKMYIFHQTRLHNFELDYYKKYMSGWEFQVTQGSAPQGLNVVIQNGSKNAVFRLRDIKSGGGPQKKQVGLTGNNRLHSGKGKPIKFSPLGQTPSLLLGAMSNFPYEHLNLDDDGSYPPGIDPSPTLDNLITFGYSYEDASNNAWQRYQVDARVNLPFWYSSIDEKWYLIFDSIIFPPGEASRDNLFCNFKFDFEKNKKNEMKNVYPSEWLSGILNNDSKYNNWFTLRVTFPEEYKNNYGVANWTTPVNWWRFVPKYSISADDYKGTLNISMTIPTIIDQEYNIGDKTIISGQGNNVGQPKKYYASNKNPACMQDVSNRTYNFIIDGWRNSVTSFNDIKYMSFDDQIQYLASNINQLTQNEIIYSIRNKFSKGKDYLNNWEVLNLDPIKDLFISYINNNLRTGQATYRVQLRKWVDSNKKLHQNDDGPYQEYVINNFYKIAGRTQLNKSAIIIPKEFSNLKVDDISNDQLHDLIIKMQTAGVKNTIKTKYTDTTQEIFTNLGDLLNYEPDFLEIQLQSKDYQNGIINLKFKLSHIYDTDINNTTFIDKRLEGTIAICGFKTDNNNSIYSLNSSAIYADKNGVVVGNPTIGTNVIGNNNSFTSNNTFKNNNYIILSQQYIHSQNARAALVYDPDRSNKIIIKLFNANNQEIKEYVFNAPTINVKVLSKDENLYANGYTEITSYLDKYNQTRKDDFSLCNNSNELINRDDFLRNPNKYFTISEVDVNNYGKKQSYRPINDLYLRVPVTNSLYWNRMITFNNSKNNNVFSDKMLIFNQGIANYYSDSSNQVELFGNNPTLIIDFTKKDPEVNTLDYMNLELKNEFIVSAATLMQNIDDQIYYSFAFITTTTGTDKNSYFRLFRSNSDFTSFDTDFSKKININFYPKVVANNGSVYNPSLYYQPPEFYLSNENGKWSIFLLSAKTNAKIGKTFDLRYQMFKSSDITNNDSSPLKQLNFIDPIRKQNIKEITPFTENALNMNGPILTNYSFANNMNKWNLTYANKNTKQYFAISVDLAKLCSSDSTSIDLNTQSILSNNDFNSENDWVYSLKDDINSTSFLAFDQANTNFINVASSSSSIKVDVPSNMANIDLSTINNEQLKSIITNDVLRAKLVNLNYQNYLYSNYSFNNIVVDYFNGRVFANLVLDSAFDFKFDKTNKISIPVVIDKFKKQTKATNLKLTDKGINYFANLAPYEIKDKIIEMVQKNQLNQYFEISNYPDKLNYLEEALLGYNTNGTDTQKAINQITFDYNNKKIHLGLNLQKGFIEVNNTIQLTKNVSIFVDIDLPTMTSLNNLELDATKIFGSNASNSLASSYKDKIINDLSGNDASKLKTAIVNDKNFANIGIKQDDIFLTTNIQFDNSKGELYVVAQIPKLLTFGSNSDNIRVTITKFKPVATSIQKRVDHKTNVAPSKLQAYLNEDVGQKALDFIQVINPVEGNNPTKIIAANVIDFDDNLGTATVSFSAINFYAGGLNQLPNDASQSGTLNATIEFENLFGSSDFLTSIKKNIDVSSNNQYSSMNAQTFANTINKNNDYATNFLHNNNAINNAADNTTFKVLSSSFDNKNGEVKLVYQLDKVKLNNGNDENKDVTFSTTVSGFKPVLGPTSYKLKDNLPNWTFEQVKQEVESDINNLKLLIDIKNPVNDFKFIKQKIVENSDGSYTIYAMVDKYYANDQNYTMIENQEISVTISKNNNQYLLRSLTFNTNKDQTQTISSLTNSTSNNVNHIALIGGIIFLISLGTIICYLISYQFRKKIQNNKE